MRKLEAADYLVEQKARSEKNEEVPVFRLRIDRILWRLGDGENVKPDPIKRRAYKSKPPALTNFSAICTAILPPPSAYGAEDHTGHVKQKTAQT